MTRLGLVLAALCCLALAALAIGPALDLEVARVFYVGTGHFIGGTRAGVTLRYAAWALPFMLFAGMVMAAILARYGLVATRFAPTAHSLAFLLLSLAIGPGLIVHATLKEISHRPRPYSVTAFGGPDRFRPFYEFDGACPHNCSFASGETAAASWTLAPASLVPPPWRAAAMAAAVAFAVGTGLWRMALGAHFLSDVCAGALATIAVIMLFRTLLARWRS